MVPYEQQIKVHITLLLVVYIEPVKGPVGMGHLSRNDSYLKASRYQGLRKPCSKVTVGC